MVPRKPDKIIEGKYGSDVRLDPCEFSLSTLCITATIPLDINPGIESEDDLIDEWYEMVQAVFVAMLDS